MSIRRRMRKLTLDKFDGVGALRRRYVCIVLSNDFHSYGSAVVDARNNAIQEMTLPTVTFVCPAKLCRYIVNDAFAVHDVLSADAVPCRVRIVFPTMNNICRRTSACRVMHDKCGWRS